MSQRAKAAVSRVVKCYRTDALYAVAYPNAELVRLVCRAERRCNLYLLFFSTACQPQRYTLPAAVFHRFQKRFLIFQCFSVCLQNQVAGFQNALAWFGYLVILPIYKACAKYEKPFGIHCYAKCAPHRHKLCTRQYLCLNGFERHCVA